MCCSTSVSPQNRQRLAARLICAPHIGQGLVSSAATALSPEVESGSAPSAVAAGCVIPDGISEGSACAASAPGAGTVTASPQPGQFARTPALSSVVLSSFWQNGQ